LPSSSFFFQLVLFSKQRKMCWATGKNIDPALKEKNRKIDAELVQDKRKLEREIRLLLLGAGDSGKSTIAKQMKIIHLNGFSNEERKTFIPLIHSNVLNSILTLIDATVQYSTPLRPENIAKADQLRIQHPLSMQQLQPEEFPLVADLWGYPAVQSVFPKGNLFQLSDSASYFLSDVKRFAQPNYVPTDEDILRVRVKTTGISEIDFTVAGNRFKMIDVGGQRSERRKWIHCFEDVTALIFCVSLSEYDQKLVENTFVNRMHESLRLFQDTCTCRFLAETPIILFFNKKDLFEKKIQQASLQDCFSDYKGPNEYESALKFIQTKFIGCNPTSRSVFPHVTCATDTSNIKTVFGFVQEIILKSLLEDSSF